MTHEEILEMGFTYAPVNFKNLPPYRRGDGSFNRYEHPAFEMAMQHYVDEGRFVMERFDCRIPYFNGRCDGAEELKRAIHTGSAMSAGDTVMAANWRRGFLMPSVSPPKDSILGCCHAVIGASGHVAGFGHESQVIPCRLVLTEKAALAMTEEIEISTGKKNYHVRG